MWFFKPKQSSIEILPPPPTPPTQTIETKEEPNAPKISDETKNQKAESISEENQPSNLAKEIAKDLKPKKSANKKEKINVKKKKFPAKKLKSSKKEVKIQNKQTKELENLNGKDNNIPNILGGLNIEDIEKDLSDEKGSEVELKKEVETKPKVIQDAEEEIDKAIKTIKEGEKPSLFKRFFGKRRKIKEFFHKEHIPEPTDAEKVSIIQLKINETRYALVGFDIETAKKNYIEIMKTYNKLKPEYQAKVYNDIKELYFERKNAEEIKV